MDTTSTSNLMNPIMQYGFAGFCVILLGILIWLVRELLSVMKENNNVITANTAAIISVDKHSTETLDVVIEVKDQLLSRPCIAKFKQD